MSAANYHFYQLLCKYDKHECRNFPFTSSLHSHSRVWKYYHIYIYSYTDIYADADPKKNTWINVFCVLVGNISVVVLLQHKGFALSLLSSSYSSFFFHHSSPPSTLFLCQVRSGPCTEHNARLCQVPMCIKDHPHHTVWAGHHGERQRAGPLCQHLPDG